MARDGNADLFHQGQTEYQPIIAHEIVVFDAAAKSKPGLRHAGGELVENAVEADRKWNNPDRTPDLGFSCFKRRGEGPHKVVEMAAILQAWVEPMAPGVGDQSHKTARFLPYFCHAVAFFLLIASKKGILIENDEIGIADFVG